MPPPPTKTPRRRPSQERSRALVAAILEAAAHVLEAHGFEGATIARVAERAGVSVGSVYQYFGTKNAVFDALTELLLERVLAATTPALLEREASFDARVERAFLAGFSALHPYPTVLRHLASGTGTAFYARLLAVRAEAYVRAEQFLATHPRGAMVTDRDLAARILVDAAEGIVLNLRREDEPQRIAREGARLVERYCAAW